MSFAGLFSLLMLGCGSALLVWVLVGRKVRLKLPYPPGPPSKGIFSGNANDLAVQFPWLHYTEWAKRYGSLLHFRAFSQHIVVLNSVEDAVELFEKRASIYSSRPFVPMWDLMGFSYDTAVRTYSPEWRKHRRIFQQTLRHDVALSYRPTQSEKIKDMLYGMLNTPDDFNHHIQTAAGAIIMSVMYGYDVMPKDDPFVVLVESTEDGFAKGPAMTWLVNSIPVLRHMPMWFPGAGFRRYAESIRKLVVEHMEVPLQYVLDKGVAGNSKLCVALSLLDSYRSEKDLQMLKEVATTAYGGTSENQLPRELTSLLLSLTQKILAGVSTTSSTILVFIVAMIMHPDVMRKAQREVDSLTGGDRLVEYDDASSMPYLEAIIREVMRWRPIAPLGIPHSCRDDDVYKGYYIPKDAIVIADMWSMTRDTAKYTDPETFNPERFLDKNGELTDDDVGYVFGFGRRICPGRHLASASVWLTVATLIQTFDFQQAKDSAGNDVSLNIKYNDGVVCYPLPFRCSITPRSDKAKNRVLEASKKHRDMYD